MAAAEGVIIWFQHTDEPLSVLQDAVVFMVEIDGYALLLETKTATLFEPQSCVAMEMQAGFGRDLYWT